MLKSIKGDDMYELLKPKDELLVLIVRALNSSIGSLYDHHHQLHILKSY